MRNKFLPSRQQEANMDVAVLPGRDLADEFCERICVCWRRSVADIFEAGRLLIEAKAQIAPGGFQQMVIERLPFAPATARRLMSIARHPLLAKHIDVLPPSWRNLSDLTHLPLDVLRARFADGSITPQMGYAAIQRLRGARTKRERRPVPAEPITACVKFVREQVEGVGPARRPAMIARLRALLDQLEALTPPVEAKVVKMQRAKPVMARRAKLVEPPRVPLRGVPSLPVLRCLQDKPAAITPDDRAL
jgi:hypothetical protein